MLKVGQAEPLTVSAYPLDRALLEFVQRERFMGSLSEAFRYVVRRFAEHEGIPLERVMQLRLAMEEEG